MAWARVQSKSGHIETAATTQTVTLDNPPTRGNKLLVLLSVGSDTSVNVSGVADGNSAALTQAWVRNLGSPGFIWTYLYFYDVPATPSTTITATFTGVVAQVDRAMLIVEFSGLAAGNTTAAALDGTAATTTGSATTSTTAGYTSHATNELLVSGFNDFGNGNTVSLSGWTLDPNSVNTSAFTDCVLAWKNSTNGAETTDTWTVGTGDQYAIGTVAFKLAGGPTFDPGQLIPPGLFISPGNPGIVPALAPIQPATVTVVGASGQIVIQGFGGIPGPPPVTVSDPTQLQPPGPFISPGNVFMPAPTDQSSSSLDVSTVSTPGQITITGAPGTLDINLTAATGQVTVTGSPGTVAQNVAAASGQITVTGSPGAVILDIGLIADPGRLQPPGPFISPGNVFIPPVLDAIPPANVVTLAASGQLVITGMAGTIDQNVTTGTAGQITVTGSPGSVAANVPAASGALSVTGSPGSVDQNITSSASGQITVTGSPGTFGVAVIGGTGQITVTGSPGTVTVSVPAAVGSITVTGSPGRVDQNVTAAVGQITVTGSPGTFGVTVPGATGAITVTGSSGALNVSVPAAVGSITIAGQPGTFGVNVPGATGQVTVTGSAGALNVSVPAAVGSITITGSPGTIAQNVIGAFGRITVAGQPGVVVIGVQIIVTFSFGAPRARWTNGALDTRWQTTDPRARWEFGNPTRRS